MSGSRNVTVRNEAVQPEVRSMVEKRKRLQTFENWPQGKPQRPETLAEAGFFWRGEGDRVKCYSCGGGLKDWDPEDDPWHEHARWYPNCHHVVRYFGAASVPGYIPDLPAESKPQHMGDPGENERYIEILPPSQNRDCSGTSGMGHQEASGIGFTAVIDALLSMGFAKELVQNVINEHWRPASEGGLDYERLVEILIRYQTSQPLQDTDKETGATCSLNETDHKSGHASAKEVTSATDNSRESDQLGYVSMEDHEEDQAIEKEPCSVEECPTPVKPKFRCVQTDQRNTLQHGIRAQDEKPKFRSIQTNEINTEQHRGRMQDEEQELRTTGSQTMLESSSSKSKKIQDSERRTPPGDAREDVASALPDSKEPSHRARIQEGVRDRLNTPLVNVQQAQYVYIGTGGVTHDMSQKASHCRNSEITEYPQGRDTAGAQASYGRHHSEENDEDDAWPDNPSQPTRSLKNLSRELQNLINQRQCKVCLDKEAVIALRPCGHLAVCEACVDSLVKCPICRGPLDEKLKVYM